MSFLPGWNSVESATAYAKYFTYAGWASLFLLGVCEILSHVYTVRKDTLVVERTQEAKAADDAEITRLSKKVGNSEQIAKATEKVEQREAADLLKLQIAGEPRRLTSDQKAKIDKALDGTVRFGVLVASTLLDGEGKDFGDDFESVLSKHWLVLRNIGRASSDTGVSIGALKNCTVMDALKILDRALTSANIEHRVVEISPDDHSMSVPFEPMFVYLFIGHKP